MLRIGAPTFDCYALLPIPPDQFILRISVTHVTNCPINEAIANELTGAYFRVASMHRLGDQRLLNENVKVLPTGHFFAMVDALRTSLTREKDFFDIVCVLQHFSCWWPCVSSK